MLKTVAAGATALTVAVGAAAYAQQPPAGAGPDSGRHQLRPEDRAAFLDARISAVHAGLQLTPEQEKTWPAFEQAYRDLAALHGPRPSHPSTGESLDPVQRTQRRAETLMASGAALKRYADAMGPLYKSLDDDQKRRFSFLSRGAHPRFHHFSFWHGGDRGEFGGQGPE